MTVNHAAQKINEKTAADEQRKKSWKDFNASVGEEIKAVLFAKGEASSL